MRFARQLSAACSLLVLLASAAHAAPTAALRWNQCDDGSAGLPTNQQLGAPGVYTQVVSGRGFDQAVRGFAFEIELRAPGGLPAAWRFDPGGCNDGALGFSLAGVGKTCPALGAGTIVISSYTYDAARGTARVKLGATLNAPVTPNPATTYGLGKIQYDHANSAAGAGGADQCGGADLPVCFQLVSASWLDAGSVEHPLVLSNAIATWQDPAGTSTCFASAFPGARVGELLPQCLSADTTVQFVELVSTGDGDHYDSHLRVRVKDVGGAIRYDSGEFLAAAVDGQPWPVGTAWLLATAGYDAVEGSAADSRMPAVLDPNGGAVELYDVRDPVTVLGSAAYGPTTSNPTPPAGSSLTRTGENTYAAGAPTPTNRAGASPSPFLCPAGDELVLLRAIGLGCVSGSADGQFVELVAPADQRFEASMHLLVRAPDGSALADMHGVFNPKPDGTPWPAEHSWLIAPSTFASFTGLSPDHLMAKVLDPAGGAVELYGGPTGNSLLQRIAYGPGTPLPAPARGLGIIRQEDGSYALDTAPAPRNFSSANGGGSACFCPGPSCADAAETALRIDQVALQCANSVTGTQYVVLRSTSPGVTYQSGLGLRVRNEAGTVVLDQRNLFAGRANGSPWPVGSAWLVAAASLDSVAGVTHDALLGASIPTTAGTIELYDSRVGGTVIDALAYGPSAPNPAPVAGQALHHGIGNTWTATATQEPENSAGVHGVVARCPCPAAGLALNNGAVSYSTATSRDTTSGRSRVRYNLAAGTAATETHGSGVADALAADLYTIAGPPSGQPIDLVARLSCTGTAGRSCYDFGTCDDAGSSAALTLGSSYAAVAIFNLPVVVSLPIHVLAGVPFQLNWQVDSHCGAVVSNGAVATAQGTLTFLGLPQGSTLTSCNGYRVDQPVPTLPAILVAQPSVDAVHLEWSASPEVTAAAVERTEDDAAWTTLGDAALANDRFTFDDRAIAPGAHLGYRLRWARGGAVEHSDATWIDVPAARLALRALTANPSSGEVTLEYVLPAAGAARLELLDLRGRRAWSRDLGVQAAGSHVVSLSSERALAAGVYWARVVTGVKQATLRLVILGKN